MEQVIIWHNNRCSKSRDSLSYLQDSNQNTTVFEYLKTPPTLDDIHQLLEKLNIPAEALIRKGEEVFKSNFKDKKFSEDEWRQILVQHPVLIERPIVIKGNKAVIGRPIDKVIELLT
jgi:arsenate reductase